MYVDDTNLTYSAYNVAELQRQMGKDLEKLKIWLAANELTLNIVKTEYMLKDHVKGLQRKKKFSTCV